VETRSQTQNDKENYQAAQAELERGGLGARKKQRIMGAKEVIGDALWAEDKHELISACDKTETSEEGKVSPNEAKSQYVPRKRLNTRRVISPKKPLQEQMVNGQIHTMNNSLKSEDEGASKPARRRKSMRKSMRKSLMVKGLPDVEWREQSVPTHYHDDQDGGAQVELITPSLYSDTASEGVVADMLESTSTFQFSMMLSERPQARESATASADAIAYEDVAAESQSVGTEPAEENKRLEEQPQVASFPTQDQAACSPLPSTRIIELHQATHEEIPVVTASSASTPLVDDDQVLEACDALDVQAAKTPAEANDVTAELEVHNNTAAETPTRRKSLRRSTRLSSRSTPARNVRSDGNETQKPFPFEAEPEAASAFESMVAIPLDGLKAVPTPSSTTTLGMLDKSRNEADTTEENSQEQTAGIQVEETAASKAHVQEESLHQLICDGAQLSPSLKAPQDSLNSYVLSPSRISPRKRLVAANSFSLQSTDAEVASETISLDNADHNLPPSIELNAEPRDDDYAEVILADTLDDGRDQSQANLSLLSAQPETEFQTDRDSDTDSQEDNEALGIVVEALELCQPKTGCFRRWSIGTASCS